MGYALLTAGFTKDVETLKGLAVAWQAMGQAFEDQPACGGCCPDADNTHAAPQAICAAEPPPIGASLCRTVDGAFMPGWLFPMADSGSMGSATDADEDAVTGWIYLAELLDDDELRRYAVRSIAAFVLEDLGLAAASQNSRRVPVARDVPEALQTIWLWRGGSCWGGWDESIGGYGATDRNLCVAPAYFAPAQWRLFSKYLQRHGHLLPPLLTHSADELSAVLHSAIVWGYNLLQRIACPNGLVSNWWKLPASRDAWPWSTEHGLSCHNSATAAGEYGADAARIPWRVSLDYLWFPEETSASPLFNDDGVRVGVFGAREYSNRWAGAVRDAILTRRDERHQNGAAAQPPPKYYQPLSPLEAAGGMEAVTRLRPDQVLPLLSKLPGCASCPAGMTASPWNGWGGYPIMTTFQVPLDGVDRAESQLWLDFLTQVVALSKCPPP